MNKPKQFNPKQIKAIELLAMGTKTYKEVAKDVNVVESTLRGWREDVLFMNAVVDRSREMLKGSLPELYQAAIEEAKDGNAAFFRTLIEHIDKIEERAKSDVDKEITFSWDIDE